MRSSPSFLLVFFLPLFATLLLSALRPRDLRNMMMRVGGGRSRVFIWHAATGSGLVIYFLAIFGKEVCVLFFFFCELEYLVVSFL